MTGSRFVANLASSGGGAIYANALHVVGSTFSRNVAPYGGGVLAYVADAAASTFSGNQSNLGGAVLACFGTFDASVFVGNHARDFGGAIWNCGITVHRSRFTSNTSDGHGGAIYFSPNADFLPTRDIRGNLFRRNRAALGGGAIVGNTGCAPIPGSVAALIKSSNTFAANRALTFRRTNDVELANLGC